MNFHILLFLLFFLQQPSHFKSLVTPTQMTAWLVQVYAHKLLVTVRTRLQRRLGADCRMEHAEALSLQITALHRKHTIIL